MIVIDAKKKPEAETVNEEAEPEATATNRPLSRSQLRRLTSCSPKYPLYFDLETTPDYSRLESFRLEPLPRARPRTSADECGVYPWILGKKVADIKAVLLDVNPEHAWLDGLSEAERSGKDRAGVYAAIKAVREADNNIEAAKAERNKLLSTTPEYCSVCAMGWAVGDNKVESILATTAAEEMELLYVFWDFAGCCRELIGYNILGFDLPVIFFRSALLGIPASRMIDTKPWGKDVLDLYAKRFPKGNYGSGSRPGKLKELAPLSGIEVPAGDVDGSQVAELMKTDAEKVAEYVRSDVEITRQLHRFYRGYWC